MIEWAIGVRSIGARGKDESKRAVLHGGAEERRDDASQSFESWDASENAIRGYGEARYTDTVGSRERIGRRNRQQARVYLIVVIRR